jgi:hypothetical protein
MLMRIADLLSYFNCALLCGAVVFIAKKFSYLEKKMSRLSDDVTAVENLVVGLKNEIEQLRDESTGAMSQADQDALADRLEALVNPPQTVPTEATPETASESVSADMIDAEPVAESGEGADVTE